MIWPIIVNYYKPGYNNNEINENDNNMATKTKWEDTIDASISLSTLLMLLIGGCTSYTIIISTNAILQISADKWQH